MPRIPALYAPSILLSETAIFDPMVERLTKLVDISRTSTKGLSPAVLQQEEMTARWLIDCLYQGFCAVPPCPVQLPLSRGAYARALPSGVKLPYGALLRVLNAAEGAGWVKSIAGSNAPLPQERSQARFCPIGELLEEFERLGRCWRPKAPCNPAELILMGDASSTKIRRILRPSDGPDIARWQADLGRINDLISSSVIYLDVPDSVWTSGVLASSEGVRGGQAATPSAAFSVDSTMMRRIFARGRLDSGGRFYGGWWQNIRSQFRRHIVIGDSLTVECDYSGMALRCLYAMEGIPFGADDPYDIGISYAGHKDPRRSIVKEFINAMLNDERGRYRLSTQKLKALDLTMQELRARVWSKHSGVCRHFHSGIGLRLQFIDSEIAMAVMLRMADQGEVCLPIHDSFIVRGQARNLLRRVMEDEFRRVTRSEGVVTMDDEIVGRRIGTPSIQTSASGSKIENIMQSLQMHFDEFSITQEFHAAHWHQHDRRSLQQSRSANFSDLA